MRFSASRWRAGGVRRLLVTLRFTLQDFRRRPLCGCAAARWLSDDAAALRLPASGRHFVPWAFRAYADLPYFSRCRRARRNSRRDGDMPLLPAVIPMHLALPAAFRRFRGDDASGRCCDFRLFGGGDLISRHLRDAPLLLLKHFAFYSISEYAGASAAFFAAAAAG